ncbi:MAG: hypothetical protein B6240_12450 [Desulfobacteraceae bacterium 4572_87]|nr:MAG: hypothetical protein B6240_12450 [Desulfobacteraceae bacterium 4572_87]
MPAKEYLDARTPPEWAKLDRILKRLGDHGKVKNIEQFRPVGDGLFEVKGGGKRMVGYFIPDHFVLTHGFDKRGGGKSANKFPPKERKKALKMKLDFEPIFTNMIKGRGHGRKK